MERLFLALRRLPGTHHSEPNVAAILLGKVDFRVDREHFRNWADSHVSLSRRGTGRHGGRPSQEPDANPPRPAYINAFPANQRRAFF
jgi:hypothetical protein